MSRKDHQSLLNHNINPVVVKNGGDGEKVPFLAEPVRLTPAWEASNLPNEELNFKGMTMERAKMEISPPIDKYKLVFFTLLLHGLGTLMPWNMFINAKMYFEDFKLYELKQRQENEDFAYAKYFMSILGFASQIPNVLFNWGNIFIETGGNLTTRIVWSIFIEIVIFLLTIILAMVDSSKWSEEFFWITMASVVVLNMANGVYQNTVFGMAAKLPPKYTGAVILGANTSGLFSSIVSFVAHVMSPSHRTAAIYYFITAVFILLVAFDTYFALPLNKFYRYHEMLNEKEIKSDNKRRIPYWEIFKQCSAQLLNVFLIFFVTLTLFPTVQSDIKPNSKTFIVPNKYFVDITCFITFNLFAMLGSLTTSWIKWPKPKFLLYPIILRFVFIPLFLLCNYEPTGVKRVASSVLIDNDWGYWSIAVLMAYSSGYLSSLAMMYVPQTVQPGHAVTAGMFGAAFLITGIFSGILFSFLFPTFASIINTSFASVPEV